MSIRQQAIQWCERKYGKIKGPIYTSKFYLPEESWPKVSVWWPQVPISIVEENLAGHINILCEAEPNEIRFYYLKVPSKFLIEQLDKFHLIGDIISLYLSTDPQRMFIELRGKGNLDFSEFLINK
jgi:hypothetical protein